MKEEGLEPMATRPSLAVQTSRAFKRVLAKKGVKQRFGAVGHSGSIAIIERFCRTVKELLGVRFWEPLLAGDLEKQLAAVLLFHSAHRTHSSLGGTTPLEAFTTAEPACRSAVRPPTRDRPLRDHDLGLSDPIPGPGAPTTRARPRRVAPASA